MYSLIVYGTFLDSLAEFCDDIRAESTPCLIAVTIFVVVASMTVMNMLIGVLCEVIAAVAEDEKETMITEKVYDKLGNIVKAIDNDGDGSISFRQLEKIVDDREALDVLSSLNVDPTDLIDVVEDLLSEHGKKVKFDDFMEVVLNLRGGLTAKLKDIYFVNKRFNQKFEETKSTMEVLHKKLDILRQS